MRGWIDSTAHQIEACRIIAEKIAGPGLYLDSDYRSRFPVTIGVLKDHAYYYAYNVRACRDLGVRYRLLDLSRSDWFRDIEQCGCDAFLVWPSALISVWKQMYDERLPILAEVATGKYIMPSLDELWLLDSKRRVRDWLVSHDVPHPGTEVFFDLDDALAFLSQAKYPLVCKTDAGASANGVFIIHERRHAEKAARQAFGKGLRLRRGDRRDSHWGYLLVQAFVAHEHEWRVARIGDHYLCRRKDRVGEFASGSGEIGWARPLPGMLDFVRSVTDLGRFTSMAVDLFVANDGGVNRFLVNELQCVFGAISLEENVNEATGRWSFIEAESTWQFEPGFFYQNACANLRVSRLLHLLGCL